MGKTTGFLDYSRENNREVPPEERLKTFCEFHQSLTDEERKKQAARCMNCGVPLCQSAMKLSGMYTGCPLHNLIPEWNDQLYQGHYEEAYRRLHKTSNFPEFTSRVCPALCEKACMCGEYGDPVTVHENENFIIENAFRMGYVKPEVPKVRSGKRVAIIGSGPSGLAAADELNHRGHSVTVFEREDKIGGLMMYGIPNMKLDKEVIKRRRDLMASEGVEFKTGVNVGASFGGEGMASGNSSAITLAASDVLASYDAVILCCGAKNPRRLNVRPDEMKIKGVYFAVDFLTATTKRLLALNTTDSMKVGGQPAPFEAEDFPTAAGKHVVVVGGGDTGNDCIGTCLREGAESLTALEMMPEPPLERAANNPWPEWPKVKKTDYGHAEYLSRFGKDPRVYETTVKEILTDKNGNLERITTVKVKFENRKMVMIQGTEQTIPCDLLLIAAGFTGCQDYTALSFGIDLTQRGTAKTQEESYQTNVEKVFTAGDMHRGQSLVVWAIAEGRACARQVDEYLMGYTTMRT